MSIAIFSYYKIIIIYKIIFSSVVRWIYINTSNFISMSFF